MADDEDPVEHEIDVFLSKSLSENLYLLQHPVRPNHVTYDNVQHLSARVKPDQKKVEMELSIDTRSANYAHSKGEQLALNVDGHKMSGERYYTSSLMDKQLLASTPCCENMERYAAGIFKEGKLHLTPLHAVLQLRPSFSYLDKADLTHKAESMAAGDAAGDSSQEEAEEDVKPVTVKFARQETEEAKARRLASYEYLQKKQEEEHWVRVQYHGPHEAKAESERMQLLASKDQGVAEFQIFPFEYLGMLMPPSGETEQKKPAMPTNVLSLSQLKTMPLGDQVRALLTNAKVLRFSQLLTLLPQGTDPLLTLRSVQQVAVMVQGCWVVKSDVLYPRGSCSPHSGISAEHLCRGRDYVMWKFTQSRNVTRKDIASVIKLPAEDVKDILEQMSKLRANHGWEFLFECDSGFHDRYPEIVQRQRMLWDAKYQTLCKHFKISKEQDRKNKEQSGEKPRRRRNSSKSSRKRTLSGRSISDHSDSEVDMSALKSELEKSDTSRTINCKQPGKTMEAAESNHVNNGPVEPMEVESSCDNTSVELKTEIFNFVQEKLFSRLVLTLSELKKLFTLKLAICPPGHVLGSGVSDKLLEETVFEVGGIRLKNQWPPNVSEEPLYALAKTGDDLDPIRVVLLEMYESAFRVTKKAFQKRVATVLGKTLTDDACKNILQNYCHSKGSVWYLKGTTGAVS